MIHTRLQRGPVVLGTIDGPRSEDGVMGVLIPVGRGSYNHDTGSAYNPHPMTSGKLARQRHGSPICDDWRTISDELLQGLVHALNNRVAALSAFAELAKLGDEDGDSLTVLPVEIAQLDRISGLFGLLPERRSDPEAVELRAVLDDAIGLHEHHPRLRGERVAVTYEGAPIVVRAPRWALVRAMVMLVHSAKQTGEPGRSRDGAALRVRGNEASVEVRVATPLESSEDLIALAERCGGGIAREHQELVFRLPSLRELRKREREARGEPPPA